MMESLMLAIAKQDGGGEVGELGTMSIDLASESIIHSSVPGENWNYGISIARSLDGTLLAVGESSAKSGSTADVGSVSIYTVSESGLTLLQKIDNPSATASDVFGTTIAFSSDNSILAIGAPGNILAAGKVFVFKKGASTYAYVSTVTGIAETNFARQAIACNSDGSTIYVSATTSASKGTVHLVTRSGSTNVWTRTGEISGSSLGINNGSNFGISLAFNEERNIVVIGAHNYGPNIGRVYVFDAASKALLKTLQSSVTSTYSRRFGFAVAVSKDGSVIAVLDYAYRYNNTGTTDVQAVEVFIDSGSGHTSTGLIQAPFGAPTGVQGCIAISDDGSCIAAGARLYTIGTATNVGVVWFISRNKTTKLHELAYDGVKWNISGAKPDSTAEASLRQFGSGVAFNAGTKKIYIGAMRQKNASAVTVGGLYTYDYSLI